MVTNMANDDSWGELVLGNPESKSRIRFPEMTDSLDLNKNKYIIGRSRDCDLQLGIKMISAHHCFISRIENKVYLNDTSANGTYINKRFRIMNGQSHEIHDGDQIYVVYRKKDPTNDFYLIFRSKINLITENGPNLCSKTAADSKDQMELPETILPMVDVVKIKTEAIEEMEDSPSEELEDPINYEELLPPASKRRRPMKPATRNVEADETTVLKEEPDQNSLEAKDSNNRNNSDVNLTSEVEEQENSNEDNTIDCEKMSNSEEEPEKKVKPEPTDSRDFLEEGLQCCLCLDVLYDPVSLQPCQHCYCAGCYSNWMDQSSQCPECRANVSSVNKNHFVKNVIEAYLKTHPEKRRSNSDIQKLEEDDRIIGGSVVLNPDTGPEHSTLKDQRKHTKKNRNTPQQCFQCPTAKSAESDCSTRTANNQTDSFTCASDQRHISCLCCLKVMPDRRQERTIDPSVPPQECFICRNIYCHLYWVCNRNGCIMCLTEFKDFNPQRYEMLHVLNNNVVESNILQTYLDDIGMSWQEVVRDCMAKLESGGYVCSIPLNPSSPICHNCALFHLKPLIYSYRADIPSHIIGGTATRRPNCYWGKNCRTQRHNLSHAQKYNHICEQTRQN